VVARQARQTCDRVAVNADESAGLTHAAAFAQVIEQRQTFFVRQFRVEQRRTLAFAEPCFAGATIQQTNAVVFAEVAADSEVFQAALAAVGAVEIVTAES